MEAELTNLGLSVSGNAVESADNPEGLVFDVSPVGVLSRGDRVTVSYYTAPQPTVEPTTPEPSETMTTVPSGITGQAAAAAEQRISAAGLVPVNGGTRASSQPQGTVVAVNPSEGAPLPQGSTVTYFTSTGPATLEPAPPSAPQPTPSTQATVPAAPNGTNPSAG
ncbi:PASTA domain-containing protein [Arthrobacter sp. ATA002]|uniref:PASTA domain-containing protein n=1 Tax=Arthrobacter sp. ATA002 TaxID=2991715 RepID=UPI003FA4B580